MEGRLPKTVGWTSSDEWSAVFRDLWSDNVEDKRRGVGVISAWRARSKLPLSIECTFNVVQAVIADHDAHSTTTDAASLPGPVAPAATGLSSAAVTSEHILRLAYSLSIVRFVNGFVDDGQKGLSARSVQSLATELKIPEHIVDIRHQATHTTLPTLAALRAAVPHVLSWLSENYWTKQTVHLKDSTDAVIQLLADYQTRARKRIRDYDELKDAIKPTRGAKAAKAAKAVAGDAGEGPSGQDPALKQIGASVPPNSVDGLLVAQLLLPGTLFPTKEGVVLPYTEKRMQKMWRMWQPALENFDSTWPYFTRTLLFAILERIRDGLGSAAGCGNAARSLLQQYSQKAAFAVNVKARSITASSTPMLWWLGHWNKQLLVSLSLDHSTRTALLQATMASPCAVNMPFVEALLGLEDTLRPAVVTQLRHLFEVACGFPAVFAGTKRGSPAVDLDTDADVNGADDRLVNARAFATRVGSFVQDARNGEWHNGQDLGENASGCWNLATDPGWIGRPLGLLAGGGMPDLEGGVTAAEGDNGGVDDDEDDTGGGGVIRPHKRRRSTRSLVLDAFRLKSDLAAQVAAQVQLY